MNGEIATAYACDTQIGSAVSACRQQISFDKPDLLLVFAGGKHPRQAVADALRAEFGEVPLAGGAAAGAIAKSGFGYTGYELGIVAFKGEDVTPQIATTTRSLLDGEFEAGQALGQAVTAMASEGCVVFLLFDSVASGDPLRLHPASQMMAGFQTGLDSRELHVIGGGMLADINLSDSWVFDRGIACKHALNALVFPPSLTASTVILHGCRPVSTFMEVTRIEGAEVLELDGQPALTVVEQMLGLQLGTTSGQQLSLVATLGQKQGDPFAPYDEANYVNRLILQATPARGSITLFEPDFAVGTRVQIMSRDNFLMTDSVERGLTSVNERLAGSKCELALYIDCAGRASIMSGAETEEAELVVSSFAPDCPFMGFYSGVEIAPFAGNYSRPLDWTGVLTVLQHRAG
jgi:hypothetical protein